MGLLLPATPNTFSPRAVPSAASSPSAAPPPSAVVIGGGLAGLAAAARLQSSNVPFVLLEASDGVGGRVRTDEVDGFLLDRGFQIVLTAAPELRRILNYPSLRLRPFFPGALVFHSGRLHRIADPFRRPLAALACLPNPIGSLPDKIRVGLARLRAASTDEIALLAADETTTADRLISAGFSPAIVDRFLRPFLAGIFFDTDLSTTSRLFDLVFKLLALGDNALPSAGIGAIPNQLAGNLPPGSLRLNSRVAAVHPNKVLMDGGDCIPADLGIIVAVEQPEAARLLPHLFPEEKRKRNRQPRSTVCLYFSADRAAVPDPILILNGSGEGIVNNMFFATNVAPSYGPEGRVLVSVSLVGAFSERLDEELAAEVLTELAGWFGTDEVRLWRHLRTYRIGFAQPDQTPPTDLVGKDPRVGEGVYICGDHWTWATFDGALVSGRRAAEALIGDMVTSPA